MEILNGPSPPVTTAAYLQNALVLAQRTSVHICDASDVDVDNNPDQRTL